MVDAPASPIATQKTEITSAIKRLREVAPQQPADPRLHWLAPVYVQPLDVRIVLEALSSAERRNEELVRERDEAREAAQFHEHNWLQERDLKVAAITGHRAAEATIASLTGQVGEMQERAAKVVEGHIYKERYRKWDFQGGNRSDDGEIVKFADRAAAAIRALEPSPPGISTTGGDGWMPIETAPKDGTHVLCCDDDGAIFRGAYNDEDEGFWSAMCGQPVVYPPEPTHWRPLPHPPGEPEATSLSVSSSSGDGA